ncbi:MAG: aryl-sulfate sulfotransferase, partial [Deltaproteobacteria bacterium]|nr:aryl-sulfate sulfotransferase [Deltaproteobacteria bacterium]
MKKKIMLIVAMLIVLPLNLAYAVEVFQTKTELKLWKPDKAYNGYTIFCPMNPRNTAPIFMIDMEGNLVHTWGSAHTENPKLLDNGNILGGNTEYDWDGNQVWKGSGRKDSWRIWNKKLKAYTTIALTRFTWTNEECWAAGGDPSIDYAAEGRTGRGEGIIETDMDGNRVWLWRHIDHTIQDRNPAWANYAGKGKTVADYPGKADVFWKTNASTASGDDEGIVGDWRHDNALDYNEDLGYVALNAKHWSEFVVIDHDAAFVSTAEDFAADPAAALQANIDAAASDLGDFVYRFGNPSCYKQGDPPGFLDEGNQQMYGAHNIEWIDEGLPGAGNMMLFNNGCYDPRGFKSSIIEINPFISGIDEKTGDPTLSDKFVNPPDAGYKSNGESNQVVYSFQSRNLNSFFSYFASSVQRLPNGNNLVCSARHGHFFEVTPDGEVVWEYINPAQNGGIKTTIIDAESNSHSVFR